MTFGQILERVFRLLRSRFLTFAAIGAIPFGALIVLDAAFFAALALAGTFRHPPVPPDPATMLWIALPLCLLGIPVALAVYGLYYGASSYAAVRVDLGLPVTAGEAFRHAWSRMGRYVWLLVLRSLIVALPILVIAVAVGIGVALLGLAAHRDANPIALFLLIPLGILLYLCAMVYAVVMSLRLSLAFPACVQEDLTARQAIRRSGELTQGAKGRIFLMLLLIYAISYAVVMVAYVVSLLIFAVAALAGLANMHAATPLAIGLAVLGAIVFLVLVLLWSAALMAAYSIAFAVFYRDQIVREEGPPLPPMLIDARA